MRFMVLNDSLMDVIKSELKSFDTEKFPDNDWIRGLSLGRMYGDGYPDVLMWDIVGKVPNYQCFFPAIYEAVYSLSRKLGNVKLRQVMVNHLEPYSIIDKHKDGPPEDMRFHLPVYTTTPVQWWDEINGTYHMPYGTWCGPVKYSGVLHSITNPTNAIRTHIIADFYRG